MNIISVREHVLEALKEDIGMGDRTTTAIVPAEHRSEGIWKANESGVIAGLDVVRELFLLLDPSVRFSPSIRDGDEVRAGDEFATIEGPTRSILTGERVSLNYLRHLSGIATMTRRAVKEVEGYDCRVADTRKTTPGMRMFEKYAVQVGGGVNHRLRLDDALLIKDNHIAVAGSITEAVRRVREQLGHVIAVEVETETPEQVKEAVHCRVDAILLDNMTPTQLREAVEIVPDEIVTEASGNLVPGQLRQVAAAGVDIISLGSLTHSVRALDISLNLQGSVKKQLTRFDLQ